MTKKEEMVKKAVKAGLGEEKSLTAVSEVTLENMLTALDSRDSEISTLKQNQKTAPKKQNVTRVSDLLRLKKFKAVEIEEDNKKSPDKPNLKKE